MHIPPSQAYPAFVERLVVVVASGDDTAAPQSAGALPRRKTKRVPTKKGDVKGFLASQKTRQQDRIADDYYRLLHLQG